ncbi:hypothetical protein SAMN05421823_105134 [Catalinimonas alkaloidigena]|uniref:Uncharacterized protein n=1 Tax=Catalinimonas alkaloidigena TaxID=1075417 RepID=A0A1G9IX73_9BACT|nr:hypothetical protein [Catalinimonas alkaloidigena]SDL29646.1 hypothetical protein SAMN05421823_105134 [Catalinimonas alkaloidigena]
MLKIVFVGMLIIASQTAFSQSYWEKGEAYIEQLKGNSPDHDGASLRTYLFQDVNYDGIYEVVEMTNKIEERSPGFLVYELSAAFYQPNVYSYTNGEFKAGCEDCSWYWQTKLLDHEHWKHLLENPVNLSKDSQQLIDANRKLFMSEIDRLIEETKRHLSQ